MSSLPPLTTQESAALLMMARQAIEAMFRGNPPEVSPPSARLQTPQGAFVTLLLHADLRGCIGTLDARRPLWETVIECAAAAAFEDPRFPPLAIGELEALHITVTLLQPPFRLNAPRDLVLGRHGLIAEHAGRRGVLLPEVAIEHGLDAAGFIRETLRKGGISEQALERGEVTLSAFEAETYGETRPVVIT